MNRELVSDAEVAALEAEFAEFRRDFLIGEPREERIAPEEVGALMVRLKAVEFDIPSAADEEAGLWTLLDRPPAGERPGRLGPFEIFGVLGQGGMGVVFAGRDPALGREVAVKLIAPGLKADEAARRRFQNEARALAALDHPNILAVHSVHERGGALYFVMPKARGVTLAEMVAERGPLSAREAEELCLQTAAALAAAHVRGIVHRDVKPGNLILEPAARRVRIVDFGIAALEGEAGGTSGTPGFMAPEQRRGGAASARSDLYGLGATLWFALTGHAPPEGKLPAACPRWFSRLVHSLLAGEPEDRPAGAEEVAKLILRRRRMRKSAALAAALVCGVAFVAVLPSLLSAFGIYGRANRLRAAWSENKYHIDGRPGLYPTLKEAAQAAQGRTIFADFDGERVLTMTDFGTFPVTLKAARGRKPVLVHEDVQTPMLATRAPLVLEGLTLQRSVPQTQPRRFNVLVQAENTELILRNCRVVADGCIPEATSPALGFVGSGLFRLEDCVLRTGSMPWAAARRQQRGAHEGVVRVEVLRCDIEGSGFYIPESPGLRTEVTLEDSRLRTHVGFVHWRNGGSFLDVTARHCHFISHTLVRKVRLEEGGLAASLRWSGEGNRFSFNRNEGPLFLHASTPEDVETLVEDFHHWRGLGMIAESGVLAGPPVSP